MASFGAVEYSESQAFCGQTCHSVMSPQFVAHQAGPHARVHCVTCHVGPGTGAFLSAKLNGSRQLALVMSGDYHRPIAAPIDKVPASTVTCEQCHWPARYIGDVTKVFYEHADDEANTPTRTTVRLKVGGATAGTGAGAGIHWHTNRANVVEYVATDEQREDIPYVKVSTPDGQVREYFAEGVTANDIAGRPSRRMDCFDCHNRPAHTFGSTPERAVDAALGDGRIDANIPFIRREAVRALRAPHPGHEAAATEIDRTIRQAVNARLPHPFEEASLQRAIQATQAILSGQRVSRDEDRVGHVRQSDRTHHIDGLLSVPRRRPQDARGTRDSAGLRTMSRHRMNDRKIRGSAQTGDENKPSALHDAATHSVRHSSR
jgi:hypothetical protein